MRYSIFSLAFVATVAGCSWFANNRDDIGGLICEVLPVFGRVCASPSSMPQIRADALRLAADGGPPP